jgi:hypothetical protein
MALVVLPNPGRYARRLRTHMTLIGRTHLCREGALSIGAAVVPPSAMAPQALMCGDGAARQ